ncbi:MAG: class II fructose-bisphosphatase [Candidatus Portnoybacteria bacterium]|nr:class II fructose-bisphosphatase [Candidatus Portnoybacteria bacterium]
MEVNLALEFVRATERAAIAAAKWIGKGESKAADKAAVDEMRAQFNQIDFSGRVVIGEGAKDKSYEIFIGEEVGTKKGPRFDIAVDPLEATASVAYGRPNAITVIATGPPGTIYHAIDGYMEKIAAGPKAAKLIDLDAPIHVNIAKTARALGKPVGEITVAVLERPRHENLIMQIRKAGARVLLFTDGDIAMAVAACLPESPIDLLMGVGGSTEAVLASAALKCLNGEILCRWKPSDDEQLTKLKKAGIHNLSKILTTQDLTKGKDVTFTATGVLSGPLVEGVVFEKDNIITHSVVMSSNPRMLRFIKTHHLL